MSQIGSFPQLGVKIKNVWIQHLVYYWPSFTLNLSQNVGTVNNSYMEHGPLYASYKWSFNFNPCQWPEINGFHWGYVFFPKINGLSVFRAPTSNWLFGTQFVGNLMDFLGEAPHFERHLGAHLYVDGLRLKLSNFRSASRPAFFQVFSGLKKLRPDWRIQILKKIFKVYININWVWPLPSNSDLQDYSIFSRESL